MALAVLIFSEGFDPKFKKKSKRNALDARYQTTHDYFCSWDRKIKNSMIQLSPALQSNKIMQVMQGLGVWGIQNNPMKNALYIKTNFGGVVHEIVCTAILW